MGPMPGDLPACYPTSSSEHAYSSPIPPLLSTYEFLPGGICHHAFSLPTYLQLYLPPGTIPTPVDMPTYRTRQTQVVGGQGGGWDISRMNQACQKSSTTTKEKEKLPPYGWGGIIGKISFIHSRGTVPVPFIFFPFIIQIHYSVSSRTGQDPGVPVQDPTRIWQDGYNHLPARPSRLRCARAMYIFNINKLCIFARCAQRYINAALLCLPCALFICNILHTRAFLAACWHVVTTCSNGTHA